MMCTVGSFNMGSQFMIRIMFMQIIVGTASHGRMLRQATARRFGDWLGFGPAAPQSPAMAAAAGMAAGQPGLVVRMNIRPFSESRGGSDEWLRYLREECGSRVTVKALQAAILELGDGQYDEWVTATAPRPGVDALLRPTTGGPSPRDRAGGTTRMTHDGAPGYHSGHNDKP